MLATWYRIKQLPTRRFQPRRTSPVGEAASNRKSSASRIANNHSGSPGPPHDHPKLWRRLSRTQNDSQLDDKRSSLEVHHAKFQYRVQTLQEFVKAAKSFMADSSRILAHKTSDDLVPMISSFMSERSNRCRMNQGMHLGI